MLRNFFDKTVTFIKKSSVKAEFDSKIEQYYDYFILKEKLIKS